MEAIVIGRFIFELRKERGLKQKELAEILSVSDKAVSRWEIGKGIPDVTSLEGLSEYFGVTINELLVGKRVEQEDIGQIADETVKHFVEKEKSMKRRLIMSVGLMVVFVVLFVACIIPRRSYCMKVGISEDNVWKVFDYVERLEKQGTEYTVTIDTKNRRFWIVEEGSEWIFK